MAMTNEKYSIEWKDHANNLSIAFRNILKQKELVDVTLVADGHFLSAHRLILAAISPYFHRIFTQMPSNQQTFVFMKDVSMQTLNDLMTFIYRGEIDVTRANLEDFLKTAKALEIKGLTDESFTRAFEHPTLTSSWSAPAYNGYQYQSSHTIRFQSPINGKTFSDSVQPCNLFSDAKQQQQQANDFQPPNYDLNQQIHFEYNAENSRNSINDNGNGYEAKHHIDDDFNDNDMAIDYSLMDQKSDANYVDSNAIAAKARISIVKHVKRINNMASYNIIADIRSKKNGRQNLHHANEKFYIHNVRQNTKQWYCTKRSVGGCRAAISTIDVDGVTMMKVLHNDHKH